VAVSTGAFLLAWVLWNEGAEEEATAPVASNTSSTTERA
jgi:hypothetical protein